MTFKEKIDKIVRDNKLGINSPSGLELFVNAGVGAITKYLRKGEEPGEETIKKILDLKGLNKEWWETGKGPVFIAASEKNHTSVQNDPAIAETPITHSDMENDLYKELYEKFVGTNSEYLVIHKDILKGHRIVAVEQFEKDQKQMEKDAKELDERIRQINKLTDIIQEITARPVNIHLTGPEKAQENRSV